MEVIDFNLGYLEFSESLSKQYLYFNNVISNNYIN